MADAVIFADCATGERMPAVNDAQLECGYLTARAEGGQSVLLTLEIRFTLESNPDTDEKVRALMADKDAKSTPGKACN